MKLRQYELAQRTLDEFERNRCDANERAVLKHLSLLISRRKKEVLGDYNWVQLNEYDTENPDMRMSIADYVSDGVVIRHLDAKGKSVLAARDIKRDFVIHVEKSFVFVNKTSANDMQLESVEDQVCLALLSLPSLMHNFMDLYAGPSFPRSSSPTKGLLQQVITHDLKLRARAVLR